MAATAATGVFGNLTASGTGSSVSLMGPRRRGLKTKANFRFRIDLWDASAGTILAHVAGIDDLEMAMAAYRVALTRWPNSRVILRKGERTVEDSGPRSVIA